MPGSRWNPRAWSRRRRIVVGFVGLFVILVVIGAAAGNPKKTASTQSASQVTGENRAARAVLRRALKDIAYDREVFHGYTLEFTRGLKNTDHSLRGAKTLYVEGTKNTFTLSDRSASGTTFTVRGLGIKLTDACKPTGQGCRNAKWAGPRTLVLPPIKKLTAAQKGAVHAILAKSLHHYEFLFALGLHLLGTTQYPNGFAGLDALAVKGSPANTFSAYQQLYKPTEDLSYEHAFENAQRYFNAANEPNALPSWRDTMGNVQSALAGWVGDAVSWQIKEVSDSKLLADENQVARYLAQARKLATRV